MCGKMNGQTDGCTMDGRMYKLTCKRMDGWTDGRMDGQTYYQWQMRTRAAGGLVRTIYFRYVKADRRELKFPLLVGFIA